MKTIVHIVYRDKFTSGYIDFMNMCMDQYSHRFLVLKDGFRLDAEDRGNITFFGSYPDLLSDRQYRSMLNEADAVIISGVFIDWDFFRKLAFSPALLRKTAFHFWGGDFYRYREDGTGKLSPVQSVKNRIKMFFITYCYRHCSDLAFLIPGDYEAFREITGVSRSCSVVKMPGSPKQKSIKEYRNSEPHSGTRIILGNSASPSNHHEEMLRLLHEQYGAETMEIHCPLSYGDQEYGDRIIRLGKELFGDRFIPMTDYMDKDAYVSFLSGCDIGVFNNDRQQGMGNIVRLLDLGKKVYIRTATGMWDHYIERGYKIYPAEGIRNLTFDAFTGFPAEMRDNNIRIADAKDSAGNSVRAWEPFLRKAVSVNRDS